MAMIRSGRTKQVSEELEKFYQKEFDNKNTDWAWGYNEEVLKEFLDTREVIPCSCFLIRYFLELHEEERDELAESYGISREHTEACIGALTQIILQEAEKKKVKKYENATETVQRIIDIAAEDFEANGFVEHGLMRGSVEEDEQTGVCKEYWDKTKLLCKMTAEKITEEELWVFGFGFHMSAEDISFFLKKVLKRADYNFWNETEFLLYLTYRFAPENRYAYFKQLQSAYRQVAPKSCDWLKEEQFSTIVIGQKSEVLEKQLREKNELFMMDENQKWPNEVMEFFAFYKFVSENLEDDTRTITRQAEVLLKKLNENITEEIKLWKHTLKNEKKEKLNYAYGKVRIDYPSNLGLYIPKGTLFYKLDKKNKRKIGFASEKEVRIEPVEHFSKEVKIAVQCTKQTKKTKKQEVLIGFVPKKTAFASSCKHLSNIYNKSQFKVPTNVEEGEETCVQGILYATCNSGTYLEAPISFFPLGQTDAELSFVSTEGIDGRAYVELGVRGTVSGEVAKKNELTECSIEDWKHKFQITNGAITENKSNVQASGGKLYNYLYLSDGASSEYTVDTVLGNTYQKKLEKILKGTQLSSTKLSQISTKKAEHLTRNDILTLCFLVYVSDPDYKDTIYQLKSEQQRIEELQARRSDFLRKTNEILDQCHFHRLYAPNPYDSFLILLLSSDEAIDAYRNLWNQLLAQKMGVEE